MGSLVYLNGRFVAPEDARVSIFDHGYLFGDGCFETLRAYEGFVFRLGAHLDRLLDSCRYLMIPLGHSREELAALCSQALERSGIANAYLRITVSRGVGKGGIDPRHCEQPTLSIIVRDLMPYPADAYASGMAAAVLTTRKIAQDALSTQIKSCNYQNNILAKLELNRLGLMEGFLLNREGFVAEGTVSNVFTVKDGILRTPSVSCGCLAGITRQAVLELAEREFGVGVGEARLSVYDLYTADECFITNTLMELIPVVRIDDRTIGPGKPGTVTRRLQQLYQELIATERDRR
jgi:branched-chain amino acid aminotransferase